MNKIKWIKWENCSFLGVEQGESGFVKSLIGRHETIRREKDDEITERRRSRVYSSHEDDKGVVPTRTASFANVDKPEVRYNNTLELLIAFL